MFGSKSNKPISVFFLFGLVLKYVTSYNVALVEYFINANLTNSLSPYELANRNAKFYDEIVENIREKHKNLDIVLFPESALVEGVNHSKEGMKGSTFVPDSRDNLIPCNNDSNFPEFFRELSCTARKNRVYLVVNLMEKEICKENCTAPFNLYNTNVVFDRKGKVIARYRKFNLYLEGDTVAPKKVDLTTFDTDFGETFGTFTCFDILFEYPSIALIRNGVKNFLFPTFWFPEMPFLTTIQTQQMWSYGNDVNLFTSGSSFPQEGSGGLGVFFGTRGTLAKEVLPRTDNYYLYQEIPKIMDTNMTCTQEFHENDAREWDKYSIRKENLTDYSLKILNLNTSINETLCQNNGEKKFCCKFRIETSTDTEMTHGKFAYNYALAVRSGNRSYGNGAYSNYIEVCGLLACSGSSLETCGQRLDNYDEISWPVTFEKIEISGHFSNSKKSMQFPNSLLADFSPISPFCTSWKTEEKEDGLKKTFSTNMPVKKLLTFAIFGRIYD